MRRLLTLSVLIMLSCALHAAPNGRALYDQNCSACHSADGSGGIGLPLVAAKLRDVSDAYLFDSIRRGRPGRVMPAFRLLSDTQVRAIVAFLRTNTNTTGRDYPTTALAGDPERGKPLYEKNCMRCHGAGGGGEGAGTGVTMSRDRSFLVMPAAINNPGFQAAATDAMIKRVILKGRRQSGMPNFEKSALTDQDVNDIVRYVRTLENSPQPAEDAADRELERPAHIYASPYDFETTVANVKQALTGSNFRIFPERYLEQGLIDEFSHNKRQLGVRFCNFKELYGMINMEPRLGVVLPCRITVMEAGDGSVTMVVPNLRVVSRWFNNDELVELWDRMEDTFETIIEEVTL